MGTIDDLHTNASRRRRRGSRITTLALAIATVLGQALSAGPANGATAVRVAPLTSAQAAQFVLTDTSYVAATNNLWTNYLTKHATVADVVGLDLTTNSAGATDPWLNLHAMRSCAASGPESKASPPVTKTTVKCWSHDQSDDTTQRWYPQGLTSTGTADGSDGAIAGKHVFAVSWHYKTFTGEPTSNGCRSNNLVKLTLLDRDTWKYRHILLVEPTSTASTASNFTFVGGHAGGIVWYGNYLFVTDTTRGIRVFDLNKISKVDTYGSSFTTVGISAGKSSACGFPYVLPEVHRYFQSPPPLNYSCDTGANLTTNGSALCFSWLSLDKTGGGPTYRLVTGEWFGDTSGGRIVRYQLNTASAATDVALPTTSGGKTVGMLAYTANGYKGLQGGMTWTDSQGQLNFGFHKGCGTRPGYYSHILLDTPGTHGTCDEGGNWAAGPPEALSYWPKLGTTQVDELWGITEGLCLSPSDPNYTAPTSALDVCSGYSNVGTTSVRALFAVGFNDPAVQSRQ